jgi:hypothetical protein
MLLRSRRADSTIPPRPHSVSTPRTPVVLAPRQRAGHSARCRYWRHSPSVSDRVTRSLASFTRSSIPSTHTRTVPNPPTATNVPSGLNATLQTNHPGCDRCLATFLIPDPRASDLESCCGSIRRCSMNPRATVRFAPPRLRPGQYVLGGEDCPGEDMLSLVEDALVPYVRPFIVEEFSHVFWPLALVCPRALGTLAH